MDLSREHEQRQGLHQLIVPGVRQAPGFVSGHWTLDRSAAESVVLVTFQSLASAMAFADVKGNAANQAAAGLELQDGRVVEVAASA